MAARALPRRGATDQEAATPAMKRFVNAIRNLPDWPSFWPRYYALKREGGRARELEIGLRRGLVAHVPGALMSAFDEVFLREVYGNALRPPLGPAPVVIDIGANAGFFSLQVFARHPDARVVAIEPLPAQVALLRRQLARNPGLDLTIDPRAVCAHAGTVEMRFDPRDEFTVAASLFPRGEAGGSLTVEATTLADLFAAHAVTRCDLLKLDCEGAEFEILYNCPDHVFAATDRIVLEVHGWIDDYGTIQDLVRMLGGKGYRVRNHKDEILTCRR